MGSDKMWRLKLKNRNWKNKTYITCISVGIILVACSQTTVDPFSGTAKACADITAIITAADETPIPFESLRVEPATFPSGDVIAGSWTTKAQVNGTVCTLGEVSAFGDDKNTFQVLRCKFNAVAIIEDEVIEGFRKAQTYIEECLPEEWVANNKADPIQPGANIVYERAIDRDFQKEDKIFIYPIQLKYSDAKRDGFGRLRNPPTVDVVFQMKTKN